MTHPREPMLGVTRRRMDARLLPIWLSAAGFASGLVMLLVVQLDGGTPRHADAAMSGMHTGAAMSSMHTGHHLPMITGMTLVMMSPFAFPLARAVARATLWWQAAVAVAAAWVAFIGLWCVMAGGLHLLGDLLTLPLTQRGAIAALTVICAVAQLSRRRIAFLNACQLTRPMRPGQPVRGGVRWGSVGAIRCLRTCALPMTLMAISPALLGSAAITVLLWWERFSGRRVEMRVPLALGYLLVGALLIAVGT